jgi:hypothetical protein
VRSQAASDRRPTRHRGAARLELDDVALREVIGGLVAAGRLDRRGHRLSLPGSSPRVDPQMQSRIDTLLAGLRAAGAAPPPVEAAADRLGIPPATIEQLRSAGVLVRLRPGMDYPKDVLDRLLERLGTLARSGPLHGGRAAAALGVPRRFADALVERRRAVRDAGTSHRPRRAGPGRGTGPGRD